VPRFVKKKKGFPTGYYKYLEGKLYMSPDMNVMKLKPPIIFNKNHADMFLNRLSDVLSEDFLKI